MQKKNGASIGPLADSNSGTLPRIRTLYSQMTEKERQVADYVLSDDDIIYRSITEVVNLSGAGYGSVVRFCKRLGYSGFQDLKIQLTKDLAVRTASEETRENSHDPILRAQEDRFADIRNTTKTLSGEAVQEAARALLEAESVLIVGFGPSAITSREIEYRLTRFGIRAIDVPDSQMQKIRATALGEKDVLFMVSFSGCTKDIIQVGEMAQKAKAKTVCLTNFAESPVSALSDVRLLTAVRIDPIGAEVASRVAMSFVLDTLFEEMARLDEGVEKILEETFDVTADTYL